MPVETAILDKLRLHNDGGRLDDVIQGYLSRKYDVGIIEFAGNGLQMMRDAVDAKRAERLATRWAGNDDDGKLEAMERELQEAERYYARPRIVMTERIPEPDENVVHLKFSNRQAPPAITDAAHIAQQQHPHDQAAFKGQA